MARPMRLAAPVTSAVLVNAAEVDDVQGRHDGEKDGKNGNGQHGGAPLSTRHPLITAPEA
jgi:hypothetical protein